MRKVRAAIVGCGKVSEHYLPTYSRVLQWNW